MSYRYLGEVLLLMGAAFLGALAALVHLVRPRRGSLVLCLFLGFTTLGLSNYLLLVNEREYSVRTLQEYRRENRTRLLPFAGGGVAMLLIGALRRPAARAPGEGAVRPLRRAARR